MKCPNCGKEIANDSQFCEHCGTQVMTSIQGVNSALVAWIMFILIICASAAEMCCLECLTYQMLESARYVEEFVVLNTLLLITFANLSVFVISIVLAKKKQLRKSSSIALCLMSAIIALGSIIIASSMYIEHYSNDLDYIVINEEALYSSISLAAVVTGVYAIYWIIAKVKHINF